MDVKKIRETLRTHSRFIRDYLAPTLATEGYQVSLSDRNTLKALFASLLATPITKSALQYSHIHKALFMITAGGAPWPYEYAMLAETVLEQWENCLGSLKEIKSDLWGPDGRLHGLRRIRDSGVGLSPDERTASFTTIRLPDLAKAHKPGNLGFKPGDWWLNTAAACRDGIIESPYDSITADTIYAYAIVISTDHEAPSDCEIESVDKDGRLNYRLVDKLEDRMMLWPSWTRFLISSRVPKAHKLLNCLRTGGNPVRVLRTYRSQTWMAPQAGVRYDGLYKVRGYAFGGSPPHTDHPYVFWYNVLLQRVEEDQARFEEAYRHPVSDEMDDWMEYRRMQTQDRGRDMVEDLTSGLDERSTRVPSPLSTPRVVTTRLDYFDLPRTQHHATFPLVDESEIEPDDYESPTPKGTEFVLNLDFAKKKEVGK